MIEIKDDLIVPFHFCFVSRRMGFISEAQGFGGPMSCHFIFGHFLGICVVDGTRLCPLYNFSELRFLLKFVSIYSRQKEWRLRQGS